MRANLKVLRASELGNKIRILRKAGKKIVFTNGCFDVLHAGHVRLLTKARTLGDILLVAVNSDASVRKLKGAGRPLVKLRDRLEVLSALETVDHVISFSEDTPEKLIGKIRPDILVKGADYRPSEIVGAALVKRCGGRVVTLPLVKGMSTTRLLEKIQQL